MLAQFEAVDKYTCYVTYQMGLHSNITVKARVRTNCNAIPCSTIVNIHILDVH